MSNIAGSDICALELGSRRPYPAWRRRLARVFGIDGDKLFEHVGLPELTAVPPEIEDGQR